MTAIEYGTLERLHRVWDRIYAGEADGLAPGRHEMEDGIYANVSEYTTKESGIFEAHRRYIDVQYVVSGEEIVETAPVESLRLTRAYDLEADILFGTGEGTPHVLRAGQAIVLLPEEAHRPGLCTDKPGTVKKVVFKVPV